LDVAAIAFGSALLGSVAGFLGALHLERRRDRKRRRGLIVMLEGDLFANAMKALDLRSRLESGNDPTFAPISLDVWRTIEVEASEFLPLDLLFKLRLAYEELRIHEEGFGAKRHGTETAKKLIDLTVELVRQIEFELMNMKEFGVTGRALETYQRFTKERLSTIHALVDDTKKEQEETQS
jgi:hypothetical protein